jgi:hypothetical protein
MERKIIATPERVEYTYTMKEFKELLGITDKENVLMVTASSSSPVVVRMFSKDS